MTARIRSRSAPVLRCGGSTHEHMFARTADGPTGEPGLEPEPDRPKRPVLPLHHSPVHRTCGQRAVIRKTDTTMRAVSAPTVVIIAAGEGTRMRSTLPKVLHPLCGRPLILWPVSAA